MAEKVTKLVIDRSKWLRGDFSKFFDDADESRLRDDAGRMCCLGFYLQACRARGLKHYDAYAPSDLGSLPAQARWLTDEKGPNNGDLKEGDLIAENDKVHLPEREREKRIAKLFRKHAGVAVTFRGRTPRASEKGSVSK